MPAQFPSAIVSPRTIENRPGVTYDANDTKTLYAEDIDNINNEIVAIENALGTNLSNIGLNGWLSLATIPTLQSSDDPVYVLRFGADMTGILAVGQKIKYTQHGSIKYGIVVAVGAYSGGNTDVSVYHGTDYDAEDTSTYPITLPCYSLVRAPFGFPMSPTKWTVTLSNTSSYNQGSPTAGVWYNLGSLSISIPVGCWKVEVKCALQFFRGSAGSLSHKVTLSTANNSESNVNLSGRGYGANLTGMEVTVFVSDVLLLTGKTSYYLNHSAGDTGMSSIYIRGDEAATVIKAICAYL